MNNENQPSQQVQEQPEEKKEDCYEAQATEKVEPHFIIEELILNGVESGKRLRAKSLKFKIKRI